MKIELQEQVFDVQLQDTPAARNLKKHLPLRVQMQELNGNEKYVYLPFDLPANPQPVGQIHTGDIMLFGTDCLVLFYQDFYSSYRYTRIGHIKNPQQLSKIIGKKSVTVKFSN